MKYSIVISESKTKFGPIVFRENLKENIKKVSELGYNGVELAIRNPKSINISKIEKLIENNNLQIVALGTGQIYFDDGLSFSDAKKSIREEAVKRVKDIINIASYFNAFVIIGLIRGKINSLDSITKKLEIAEERISECLFECISYSRNNSVNFLLEPINRYETNIFNKLEDVSNFLIKFENRLDTARIGILADTFHMNIEEAVIEDSFKTYFKLIKHVHFADSNRYPPGYGHINFNKIMNVLKTNKYNKYISFEMLPFPDSDISAKIALEFIKKLI